MWFPYFLNKQKQDLLSMRGQLAEKVKLAQIKLVTNVKPVAQQLYDSYKYLSDKTLTTLDKIKSYIPGTKLFKIRVICAKRAGELRNELKKTERVINRIPIKARAVKSKSDSEIPALNGPKIHKNPLNWPKVKNVDYLLPQPNKFNYLKNRY